MDAITHNLRRAAGGTSKINVGELDAAADGVGRTSQVGNYLVLLTGRGAVDVGEGDVGHVHAGGVVGAFGGGDVKVTLVQHDGVIGVLDVDVLVGDVVDIAVSDILARPRLETGSVLVVIILMISSERRRTTRRGSHLPGHSARSRSGCTHVR